MSDNITDLGIEITCYLTEIQELQKIIKEMDADIIKEATSDKKLMMQEVIHRYETVIKMVKVLLEAYFEEERKENQPPYFAFRRLYKKLIQAL